MVWLNLTSEQKKIILLYQEYVRQERLARGDHWEPTLRHLIKSPTFHKLRMEQIIK